MAPGQPSRTSILVAAARAFGAREPDVSVRNPDDLAAKLIGPEELARIAAHPIAAGLTGDYAAGRERMEIAGMANIMLIRTRWIEEHLERALAEGATQLVILGAGFDTRAWRFADRLRGKRVFEVDYHSTQEVKKQRAQTALGGAPENLTFVEIDFQRDKLSDVLRGAGFNPREKTFFVWEGVSMYIREEGVLETLRTVAESAPGSELVMDFAGRRLLEMMRQMPEIPQHKYTTLWGEPWIFGLPDGREKEFFRECGLELDEILPFFGKAARKYLTKADGTRLGPRRGRPPRSETDSKPGLGRRLRMLGLIIQAVTGTLRGKYKWYALAHLRVPA